MVEGIFLSLLILILVFGIPSVTIYLGVLGICNDGKVNIFFGTLFLVAGIVMLVWLWGDFGQTIITKDKKIKELEATVQYYEQLQKNPTGIDTQ